MRKFNDLTDMDKGVFIVREEIKKQHNSYCAEFLDKINDFDSLDSGFLIGLVAAINICNECLDIATLGGIEDKE